MSPTPANPVLHPIHESLPACRPEGPGLGCLLVWHGDRPVPTPLRKSVVELVIDAFSERTEITHEFVNESRETIECVYVTALPFGAAIDHLSVRVGDRVWNGRVERRERARAIYEEARDAGRRSALLELDEDDVGTLSLGSVGPGEVVAIRFVMVRPLPLREGLVEVRLPLVLGSRFTAAGGAGVRGPNALPVGQRPATELSIRARILGLAIEELSCTQHAVVERRTGDEVVVTLARKDAYPDRDFVLRFVPATPVAPVRVLTDARVDPEGRALAAHLAMPLDLAAARPRRLPRDLVFLVDRSGSMEGPKMEAARRATRIALRSLEDGDRFAVLAFDDVVEAPNVEGRAVPQLLPFSQAALDRADAFLLGLGARGGTEIGRALENALAVLGRGGEERERAILLLTDGQVQGLDRILEALGRTPPPVLALGIDDASNAGAVQRIAHASGGESRWAGPGEDVEAAVEELVASLDVSRLRSLGIWAETTDGARRELSQVQGLRASLRPGAATTVFAFAPQDAATLVLAGTRDDGTRVEYRARLDACAAEPGALGKLWAAALLSTGREQGHSPELLAAIALRFGILSREVALVLVGDATRPGGPQRRIDVAVATPSGWRQAPASAAPGMPPPAPLACASAMPAPLQESNPKRRRALAPDRAQESDSAAPKLAKASASHGLDATRDLLAAQRADGSFGDGTLRATLAALRALLGDAASPLTPRLRKALGRARAFVSAQVRGAAAAERNEASAVLAEVDQRLGAAG